MSVRGVLSWLACRLPEPRVIRDRDGLSPYLSRWYLLGRRLGERGGESTVGLPFNLFLHRFHRSDNAGELHSHPWAWSVSLILTGGYSEERRQADDSVTRRVVLPGSINVIRANDYHRVDLLQRDCWTVFLVGPKVDTWFFWDRKLRRRCNWRGFVGLQPLEWESDRRLPDEALRGTR